ncbi:MAG TPA: adenylate/guanylate cyclase domain-containing protein [Nitrospirales bacterium]
MKILVVDDEDGIRTLCCQVLKHAGYEVSTSANGEEALQRLHENWDIILTDLNMPGLVDGNELTRQARAKVSAEVLIMTGYPDLETAIQAIKGGAFDYLIKPFTADALLIAVQRCIDKRELCHDLAREKVLRTQLNTAYVELAKMERVRETFGQFVTPEVVDFVMDYGHDICQHGERKIVTILFADVRRFTWFTAHVSPEEVMTGLNEVFECVIDAVQHEGGILNKFIGDGLMALFGAPVPNPDHVAMAMRAALRARDATENLANARRARGLDPLRIGIGINTGEVVAGCVGTKKRTEYSVFGHAVNLAARLEEVAAPGQILMGPETGRMLAGQVIAREVGHLALPGIDEPTPVIELVKPTE